MLSNLRLRPETDFPPLYGRPDGSFGNIVGGLDAMMVKEGEKVLPVVKQPFCSSLHSWVRTVSENYTEIVHPFPHGQSIEQQFFPGASGAQKSMPEGEDSLNFRQHVSGEARGMGT